MGAKEEAAGNKEAGGIVGRKEAGCWAPFEEALCCSKQQGTLFF